MTKKDRERVMKKGVRLVKKYHDKQGHLRVRLDSMASNRTPAGQGGERAGKSSVKHIDLGMPL